MKQHANGQALRQADNIKEKDANVYLTHTDFTRVYKNENKWFSLFIDQIYSSADIFPAVHS